MSVTKQDLINEQAAHAKTKAALSEALQRPTGQHLYQAAARAEKAEASLRDATKRASDAVWQRNSEKARADDLAKDVASLIAEIASVKANAEKATARAEKAEASSAQMAEKANGLAKKLKSRPSQKRVDELQAKVADLAKARSQPKEKTRYVTAPCKKDRARIAELEARVDVLTRQINAAAVPK